MENKNTKFWAGGFLYNPKINSVLLHKRDGKARVNPNKWAFFGGLNEDSETPKQTFVRELYEELGIKIQENEIKPLGDYFNEELQTHRYVFYVESDLKKSQMHLGEGEGFDWISLDKVFEYDLTEKTRQDLMAFLYQHEKKGPRVSQHKKMRRGRRQLEDAVEKARTKKEKAIAYYNLGLFHDNNGREATAIPNYLQAIKFGLGKNLKPKALAWLASSLYKTGKPKEALKRVAASRRIADDKLKHFLMGLEIRIKKSMRIREKI